MLDGELDIPAQAPGIVLFAHGSGSSRHSPRNQFVAEVIRRHGAGTLLFDLLTGDEEQMDDMTGALRFDIGLLARRLADATRWLENQPDSKGLAIGYFGASTGGGAALAAAAEMGNRIAAVVSRGGRPDLAGAALPGVRCPVLLIVGGLDDAVIELNKAAFSRLRCKKEMHLVPGATHLFAEPGTLEKVAALSAEWFRIHMRPESEKQEEQSCRR